MPSTSANVHSPLSNALCDIAPIQPALRSSLPDYRERVLPWNEVCQKRNALFYTFRTAPDESAVQVPVFPDACADILICCDALDPEVSVCPRRLEAGELELRPNTRYFGFKPFSTKGMCLELDAAGAARMVGDMRKWRLFEGLCAAKTLDGQIERFCAFARQCLIDYSYRPDMVEQAELLICATNGNIRIDQLGRELFYSPRYCRERFHKDHGTSLKTTCDILRFQNLLRLMERRRDSADGELAYSAGYFDQSHMIHSFRRFTGSTPRKFLQLYVPSCAPGVRAH